MRGGRGRRLRPGREEDAEVNKKRTALCPTPSPPESVRRAFFRVSRQLLGRFLGAAQV